MWYTQKEAETADQYIENLLTKMVKNIVSPLRHPMGWSRLSFAEPGAGFLSARDFEADVKRSEQAIREILKRTIRIGGMTNGSN